VNSVASFRKDIEFKVVKTEQKSKEEAGESSEPKTEPKREPVADKSKWLQQFQALRAESCRVLEHAFSGLPNVLRPQQDNTKRFFYVLQNLVERVEPGKTSSEMMCVRDDFEVLDVQQAFHWDCKGVTNIEVRFERLGPQKIGLNTDKIMALVKEVIGGSTSIRL